MKKLFAVILSAIFALTGTFALAATQGDDGIAPAAYCSHDSSNWDILCEPDNSVEHYYICRICGATTGESHTGRDNCRDAYCSVCNFEYDDIEHDLVARMVSFEDGGEQHEYYCVNLWCDYVSEEESCSANINGEASISAEEYGVHNYYYPCYGCEGYVYAFSVQCAGEYCDLCYRADW